MTAQVDLPTLARACKWSIRTAERVIALPGWPAAQRVGIGGKATWAVDGLPETMQRGGTDVLVRERVTTLLLLEGITHEKAAGTSHNREHRRKQSADPVRGADPVRAPVPDGGGLSPNDHLRGMRGVPAALSSSGAGPASASAPGAALSAASAKRDAWDSRNHGQHPIPQAVIDAAWARFAAAPELMKCEATAALRALDCVAALVNGGVGKCQAREQVAAQMRRDNIKGGSPATLSRWAAVVGDAPRSDWLALLLPDYGGRTAKADCAEQCWDWYKGHYLSRKKPSHASTYRRVAEMATAQGWVIPSAKTLRRRLDEEVSRLTRILMREGAEAMSQALPTRARDALVFTVGQAVNGDGLKFDKLWVRFPDGEIINTATAWFWQDIRTRKMLAWRLDRTENTDVFRLATYDLTALCAPEHIYIDNTRVAANKLMTAGVKGRHRFKNEPEDGLGLLPILGMTVHFTNPDKELGNPGAKPIERAFGIGGIHSEVATHPRLAGQGYSKATAIDVALLREVVAEEVKRFNARPMRQTQACHGITSFDQAWQEGMAQRPPRVLADSQRRLLLMSREVMTVKATGLIELAAGRSRHGKNSYFSDRASQFVGQRVAVHFDPENLAGGVHVYSLEGRYLFAAEHRASAAFNDTQSARNDARWKAGAIKAEKKAAALSSRRDAQERANLYRLATDQPEAGEPINTPQQSVVEGHFKRVANPERDAARGPDEMLGQVLPMKRAVGAGGGDREFDLARHLEAMQQRRIADSGWVPQEQDQ